MSQQQPNRPDRAAIIDDKVERDRQIIKDAESRGTLAKLGAFTRLSGPGWIQSAITLGGGSLAGGLFLGMIAGFNLMWVQPLAMLLGVIMLSAIGYVVISSGQRPFRAINNYINPVLGWSWAIAAMMANFIWAMPQYTLGNAALRQNLFPEALAGDVGLWICTGLMFGIAAVVIWFYNSGGWGIKLVEGILKGMIAIIVLSFFAVVAYLAVGGGEQGGLDWGGILAGFIPDFRMLFQASEAYTPLLAAVNEAGGDSSFWRDYIVSEQRDRIITVVATAVGINMTFMLPYSMLARGWDRDFRGLAKFDMFTGLFIPFLLGTSCIVIAAATQFHASEDQTLIDYRAGNLVYEEASEAEQGLIDGYYGLLEQRYTDDDDGAEALAAFDGDTDAKRAFLREELASAEGDVAGAVVTRDAQHLALSLEPLAGPWLAQYIFGIGVFGMAVSTLIVLALINGFVICEVFNLPARGAAHRIGSFACLLVGALGPFIWAGAAFYLAVPTSLFGAMLLPIAYIAFLLLMNNKNLLGKEMPRGGARIAWNGFMGVAVVLLTLSGAWSLFTRTGNFPILNIEQRWVALGVIAILIAIGVGIHLRRKATGFDPNAQDHQAYRGQKTHSEPEKVGSDQ